MKNVVEMLSRSGKNREEIKQMAGQMFDDIEKKGFKQKVIFTECSCTQLDVVSKTLEDYLEMNVAPVGVKDLKNTLEKILDEKCNILSVVTSGFRIKEVEEILSDIPVYIHTLIIGMSSQTREALRSYEEKSCIGFICSTEECLPLHEELLHEELGAEINLLSSVLNDESKVEDILKTADVILSAPEVCESVKKMAPSDTLVFDVYDYIDHMSLKLLKDKVQEMM